jgi:hypothetical protein
MYLLLIKWICKAIPSEICTINEIVFHLKFNVTDKEIT